MKQLSTVVLCLGACFVAAPSMAQPTIGGGTCSSLTLNEPYAVMVTGRGVTAASAPGSNNLSSVLEAIGSVTFDGLNKVTFSMTEDTNTASGVAFPWTQGTYTVQANCAATVTVTSGGTATLNVMPYNNGASFSWTGSDSTYAYAGTGNAQAVGCSTSTLVGQYAIVLGQGYFSLAAGTAGGAATISGVAQFDGAGNITATAGLSANALHSGITQSVTGSFTGTYSLGTNCIGTGTITSALFGTLNVRVSVYTSSTTLSQTMYVTLASPTPNTMATGTAMWIGPVQSLGTALDPRLRKSQDMVVEAAPAPAGKGGRS